MDLAWCSDLPHRSYFDHIETATSVPVGRVSRASIRHRLLFMDLSERILGSHDGLYGIDPTV